MSSIVALNLASSSATNNMNNPAFEDSEESSLSSDDLLLAVGNTTGNSDSENGNDLELSSQVLDMLMNDLVSQPPKKSANEGEEGNESQLRKEKKGISGRIRKPAGKMLKTLSRRKAKVSQADTASDNTRIYGKSYETSLKGGSPEGGDAPPSTETNPKNRSSKSLFKSSSFNRLDSLNKKSVTETARQQHYRPEASELEPQDISVGDEQHPQQQRLMRRSLSFSDIYELSSEQSVKDHHHEQAMMMHSTTALDFLDDNVRAHHKVDWEGRTNPVTKGQRSLSKLKTSSKAFSTRMVTAKVSKVSNKIKHAAVAAPSKVSKVSNRIKDVAVGAPAKVSKAASLVVDPIKNLAQTKRVSSHDTTMVRSRSFGGDLDKDKDKTWDTLRVGSADDLKQYLRKGRKDQIPTMSSSNTQNATWNISTPMQQSVSPKNISEICGSENNELFQDYLKRFGFEQGIQYPDSPLSSDEEHDPSATVTPASSSSYVQLQISDSKTTEGEKIIAGTSIIVSKTHTEKKKKMTVDSHPSSDSEIASTPAPVPKPIDNSIHLRAHLCRTRSGDGMMLGKREDASAAMSSNGNSKSSSKSGRRNGWSNPRRPQTATGSTSPPRTLHQQSLRARQDDDMNSSSDHGGIRRRRRRRSRDTHISSSSMGETAFVSSCSVLTSSDHILLSSRSSARNRRRSTDGRRSRSTDKGRRREKKETSPHRLDSSASKISDSTSGSHESAQQNQSLTPSKALSDEQFLSVLMDYSDGSKSENASRSHSCDRRGRRRVAKSSTSSVPSKYSTDLKESLNHSKTRTSRSRDTRGRRRRASKSPCGNGKSSNNNPALQNSVSSISEDNNVLISSSNHSVKSRSRSSDRRRGRSRSGDKRGKRGSHVRLDSSNNESSHHPSSSSSFSCSLQRNVAKTKEIDDDLMKLSSSSISKRRERRGRRRSAAQESIETAAKSLRNLLQEDESESSLTFGDSTTLKMSHSFVF